MDKEKQIEELTSIIDSFNIRTYANAQAVAKFLVEKYGYQKIPEGSIVLTEEEYEGLQIEKDFNYGYHEGEKNMEAYYENIKLPDVRKQAVKEVIGKVKDCLNVMEYLAKTERKTLQIEEVCELMDWVLHKVVPSTIDEIAKEMGVEYKE